uniref:O-acyltransferase WSD1 C-terminal domain-containing protein n=1 Tax=Glossina austeni TaxID=7395 RepID=A0A1A9VJC5_GLOAU
MEKYACVLKFYTAHYSNQLVYYVLSTKYPNLLISQSKKIRTLIDTPRNAGIFHFLLQIRGPCDFEKIKQFYEQYLTNARDKTGYLKFPKLRQQLVTCWGHYAWNLIACSSFNVNNHILLNTEVYRGRSVNDGNIQEFVSDLARKYIPSDLPQWQVIVIPTSLRASTSTRETEASSEPVELVVEFGDTYRRNSRNQNLAYFVRKPQHIENLLRHIGQLIVNMWSKFNYNFESLETPDDCNRLKITCLSQLLSLLLFILIQALISWWKLRKIAKKRSFQYLKYRSNALTFNQLLMQEAKRRNLSWKIAKNALLTSCHPVNVVTTLATIIVQININGIILIPYHVYCELFALRELVFKGQTTLTSSYCGRLSIYVPLVVYAQIEFIKICWELFKAPVNIYEELFEYTTREPNILHMKSYSGRKIVSFSKSIDAQRLRQRVSFNKDFRESDFTLACVAGAIYDYFKTYADSAPVPQTLNTTCRTIAKGYFTERLGDKADNIGGVVFLQLPLKIPDRKHVQQIHSIIEKIRSKQVMIYLASMGQTKHDMITALLPRVLTKICINYFSFNFPVTITKIHGENSEFQTLWGQQVDDVLLFRPPQSKTCLSLNIHRFGDKYRLAIMADTELGPDHSQISRSFENYMENATL